MQSFSREQIDEVLAQNDIVDVVSEYVRLEKKGNYLFGLCPFHSEKTASFSVTPSKQIFYCYSCQKGGNALHFVMEVENLRFIDALKFLAQKSNIELKITETKEDKERVHRFKQIIKINTDAARFFHKSLMGSDGKIARDYLENRGISQNTIVKFGLGYSLNTGNSLLKHLEEEGYDKEHIKQSGLILQSKDGQLFDRFRARLMFPIFDIRGSVIAFGGRVLDDSQPKYMNSSETVVYNKSRNLYALNYVRKSGEKKIIVVEGYMDVVSLHQHGVTSAVASLGTSLTQEQAKLLRMYGEEVFISYDADIAGKKATVRGLDVLEKMGCLVKVLTIPEGKDPDDYIKSFGKNKFDSLVKNAVTYLEYKVGLLKQEIDQDSTSGKIEFLNKTADILAEVGNTIERDMYIRKLALEYGIKESSLEVEVARRTGEQKNKLLKKQNFKNKQDKEKIVANNRLEPEEQKKSKYKKMLLCLLCMNNDILNTLDTVEESLESEVLEDGELDKMLKDLIENIKSGNEISLAQFIGNLPNDKASEYVAICENECVFEDKKKAFEDIVRKLKEEKIKKRQREILDILKKNDIEDEEYIEKLKNELSVILTKRKNF